MLQSPERLERSTQHTNNTYIQTTLMKKLLSLALLVAVTFIVGCQKSDEDKAKDAVKDAGTTVSNAIPK
jgi:hypothetical protein